MVQQMPSLQYKMRPLVLLAFLTVAGSSAQLTSICDRHDDMSCSATKAADDRRLIMNKLDIIAAKLDEAEEQHKEVLEIKHIQDCIGSNLNIKISHFRYIVGLRTLTWNASQDLCFTCGYELATIETEEEYKLIRNWLVRIEAVVLVNDEPIWVNGTVEDCEIFAPTQMTGPCESKHTFLCKARISDPIANMPNI